jgi:hypothetical protein
MNYVGVYAKAVFAKSAVAALRVAERSRASSSPRVLAIHSSLSPIFSFSPPTPLPSALTQTQVQGQ